MLSRKREEFLLLEKAVRNHEFPLEPIRYRTHLYSVEVKLHCMHFLSWFWWRNWSIVWFRERGSFQFVIYAGPLLFTMNWWLMGDGTRWKRTFKKWKKRKKGTI